MKEKVQKWSNAIPKPKKSCKVYCQSPIQILNQIHYTLQDFLKETMSDYTQASSLHGVQYIFENGRSLKASRIAWLCLALFSTVLGIVWSVEVVCFVLLKAMKVF